MSPESSDGLAHVFTYRMNTYRCMHTCTHHMCTQATGTHIHMCAYTYHTYTHGCKQKLVYYFIPFVWEAKLGRGSEGREALGRSPEPLPQAPPKPQPLAATLLVPAAGQTKVFAELQVCPRGRALPGHREI